jgi:hypothetical protein
MRKPTSEDIIHSAVMGFGAAVLFGILDWLGLRRFSRPGGASVDDLLVHVPIVFVVVTVFLLVWWLLNDTGR